jgi:predicted nucleic acid-binding protein
LKFHVSDQVAQEAKWILQPSDADPERLEKAGIDLTDHYASGVLATCKLESEQELLQFVTLAANLDDGEAACLSLAANRKWLLASDDRVARRIAGELGVDVIGTPQIIKRWANQNKVTGTDLASTLQAIQKYARFVPHRTAQDFDWWMNSL